MWITREKRDWGHFMGQRTNKLIELKMYEAKKKKREIVIENRTEYDRQYLCMMTEGRLQGQCQVLVYDRFQNSPELFILYFVSEGLKEHYYLTIDEMELWKQKHQIAQITYRQALTLLGDAMRYAYKQKTYIEEPASLHIQRVWQNAYYDEVNNTLCWLLEDLSLQQFVTTYATAIGHKDAALIYDMLAVRAKESTSREIYVYSWNHVLEEVDSLEAEILDIEHNASENSWTVYLFLKEVKRLHPVSVSACLQIVYENGGFRLLREAILEADAFCMCI